MAIILKPVPQRDSRGLPEGYDVEMLFRYRYQTLVKGAVGFESFLYKLIPYAYVKSFAFAIDPTHRFKVSPGTITAANRSKYRSTASVITQLRTRSRRHIYTAWSQESNYKNHSICSSPYLVHRVVDNSVQVNALSPQTPLADQLKDTTTRTRLVGSTQGELEMFKSELFSPPRTTQWVYRERRYSIGATVADTCSALGGVPDYEVGSDESWITTVGPTAATLSADRYESLRTSELAFCRELSQHHATSMLREISPWKREYSLSRNVAELKDLARSMLQLKQTADSLKKLYSSLSSQPKLRDNIFDLSRGAVRNVPSEYLSFHFGWKQLWKDLADLTALPEKLSKRVNFLISRSGKPTTFRSKRTTLSGQTGVSGFVYDTHDREFIDNKPYQNSSRISRESETRLVINAIFDFPPANVPHFRRRFFLDKVGLIPRFVDVYNIVPWSWLVDWFTGFGNYLEMIEEINHDPSLINWGLITTRTHGKLVTETVPDAPTIDHIVKNNVVTSHNVNNIMYPHTSVLEFECQTRQNVSTVFDVKQTTIKSSLTTYQLSILGALLAQRTDNSSHRPFRPR